MDMSSSGEHPLPEQRKEYPPHLVFLSVLGFILVIVLIGGTAALVSVEQTTRAQQRVPKLASPAPLIMDPPIAPAKPRASYQPQIPELPAREAVHLLTTATINPSSEYSGDHLIRWERDFNVKLHGRIEAADRSCVQNVASQLNQAMETVEFTIDNATTGEDVALYFLPRAQFSSVDTDIAQDAPTAWTYRRGYNHSMDWARIIIDSEEPIENRCFYVHQLMQDAIGIRFDVAEAYGDSHFTSQPIPATASYSPHDLELARTLYSPFLISGLSTTEVERRLLAE